MSCLHDQVDQPPHWDHTSPEGQYFNRMFLAAKHTVVPQHSHTEPHTTLLVRGSLAAVVEGDAGAEVVYHAPAAIHVPAFKRHTFTSLEDNTEAWCVFRAAPVTHEEHQLPAERVA